MRDAVDGAHAVGPHAVDCEPVVFADVIGRWTSNYALPVAEELVAGSAKIADIVVAEDLVAAAALVVDIAYVPAVGIAAAPA